MNPRNESTAPDLFNQPSPAAPSPPINDAVYSSCYLVIERIRDRLLHLDEEQFPTRATLAARDLVLAALDAIQDSILVNKPAPRVVYERLVSLRSHALTIERSNSTLVSWPIACWFEERWKTNVRDPSMLVFFAQRLDHNYSIQDFTNKVLHFLEPITTEDVRERLGKTRIFCLSLASLEEDNVPLYANVGHEFGHIICGIHQTQLNEIVKVKLSPISTGIDTTLSQRVKNSSERTELTQTFTTILYALAEEAVSDAFAAFLMGPSYILSMNEISWASEAFPVWGITILKPEIVDAHPSLAFRLNYLDSLLSFTTFRANLDRLGQENKKQREQGADDQPDLRTETYGHFIRQYSPTPERPLVQARITKDQDLIQSVLVMHFPSITKAISAIAKESYNYFEHNLQSDMFKPDQQRIYGLLLRLAHQIPPNIIEDASLLGQPADVPSIILAACLYRQKLFADATPKMYEETKKALSKLDRLTAKAIEATFVQRLYQARRKETT
jgi:hypothetical protein